MTADEYRSLRQERGTQKGVATLLGVDYRTIQRREYGEFEVTREAALAILALPARGQEALAEISTTVPVNPESTERR